MPLVTDKMRTTRPESVARHKAVAGSKPPSGGRGPDGEVQKVVDVHGKRHRLAVAVDEIDSGRSAWPGGGSK